MRQSTLTTQSEINCDFTKIRANYAKILFISFEYFSLERKLFIVVLISDSNTNDVYTPWIVSEACRGLSGNSFCPNRTIGENIRFEFEKS